MNTLINHRLDMKTKSRIDILNCIRYYKACSRVDIASSLGIAKSLVTVLTNEMIQEGLLLECGESTAQTQKRGRRKVLLKIDENCRLVFGAVIEKDGIVVGITNLNGDSLEKRRMPIGNTYREMLSQIVVAVEEICSENYISLKRVLGIGVCLSDSAADLVEGAGSAERLTRLKRDLSHALTIPIITSRTVSGMLIAQRLFGGGNVRHAALVRCCGQTAEVGILINGKPYSGSRGLIAAQTGSAVEPSIDPVHQTAQTAALCASVLDPEKILFGGTLIAAEGAFEAVADEMQQLLGRRILCERAFTTEERIYLAGCAIAVERRFYLDSSLDMV